ncbi:MAG: hypothetical protein E5V92_03500 [Mesorhizobium sp.]|nr:MAG: hypothetical protein E5V92_03500 [Mesorhizobium sp.]
MDGERKSPWNSLEVVKLCASLLTPIVIALIGYFVQQQLAVQSRAWQSQQRILERRLQIYDAISGDLNRIYCFVDDVGTWKEDNPETIISYKRAIDRKMFSQQAIWSRDVFKAYNDYMNAAFKTYQGVGTDAQIRTTDAQKKSLLGWKPEWSARLTEETGREHNEVYLKLMELMSRDMSLVAPTGN